MPLPISRVRVRFAVLTALCLLPAAALAVSAQARAQAPEALPTCAARGPARLAVLRAPGQDADSLQRALARTLPRGTRVHLFEAVHRPSLRNTAELRETLGTYMRELGENGWGRSLEAVTLLDIDETGRVTATRVEAGHDSIDVALHGLWSTARFTPFVRGGCRMPVRMRAPLRFVREGNRLRVEYERAK